MENYTIDYEIIYRRNYRQNLINIKFIYNEHLAFNFQTLYYRFYEIFAQNYNHNYYYCQLSQNCELEFQDIDEGRIINFILSSYATDDFEYKNKINFYAKLNDNFYIFLDKLKNNHCKVIKNSKW